jgi:hypothetical protein
MHPPLHYEMCRARSEERPATRYQSCTYARDRRAVRPSLSKAKRPLSFQDRLAQALGAVVALSLWVAILLPTYVVFS